MLNHLSTVRCSLRAASRQLSEYSSTRAMNSVWKHADDDSYFVGLSSLLIGSVIRRKSSLGTNEIGILDSAGACLSYLFIALAPALSCEMLLEQLYEVVIREMEEPDRFNLFFFAAGLFFDFIIMLT